MKKKKWSDLSKVEQADLLQKFKKKTGREACQEMGVDYKSASSSLSYNASKGMGKGGRRKGSGNKKGIKFCGTCRKQLKDCTCKK